MIMLDKYAPDYEGHQLLWDRKPHREGTVSLRVI